MSNQSGSGRGRTDVGSWIITLIMLWVFFPVGVILLVINLKKAFEAPPSSSVRPMRPARPAERQPMTMRRPDGQWTPVPPVEQRQSAPVPPAGQQPEPRAVQQTNAGRPNRAPVSARGVMPLRIGGVCLIVAGLFGMAEPLEWLIRLGFGFYDFWELLRWLGFAACGVALILVAERRRRRAERYADYLAVIGESQLLSLDFIASATGRPYETIVDDLQDMIRLGYFGDETYLDLAERCFVACHAAAPRRDVRHDEPDAVPAADSQDRYPEEAQLRLLNDSIADEHVSACMDRLEELTHKIFAYVEAHPEKEARVRRFRAHYLPRTIKICESYARFEQQGVKGDNIRSAMHEVEEVMDSLVRGFENQLDMLFDDEALDVSTDISVLESMMAPAELKIEDFLPKKAQ